MNKKIVFTIVARNYLAYAIALGKSVYKHNLNTDYAVFLLDDVDKYHRDCIDKLGYISLSASDIAFSEFDHIVFQYNITEASTAVKPFVIKHLLSLQYDAVIYLDPDIQCFQPLDEVFDILKSDNIVITPHSLSPVLDDTFPTDYMHLQTGTYNLGFIAVANRATAHRFVSWWCERLLVSCIEATEMGLFVDQKWIDLVPAYFEGVRILRNLGYNVAYWNLHERTVICDSDGVWRLADSNQPLIFYHFSGVTYSDLSSVTKYAPKSPFRHLRTGEYRFTFDQLPDLKRLYESYATSVRDAGADEFTVVPYAYACYDNGDRITQLERRLFLQMREQYVHQNPFKTTPHSFYARCRNSGLRKPKSPYRVGSSDKNGQQGARWFGLIRTFLKLVVRVVGSDSYVKLAKYAREQMSLLNQTFLVE